MSHMDTYLEQSSVYGEAHLVILSGVGWSHYYRPAYRLLYNHMGLVSFCQCHVLPILLQPHLTPSFPLR